MDTAHGLDDSQHPLNDSHFSEPMPVPDPSQSPESSSQERTARNQAHPVEADSAEAYCAPAEYYEAEQADATGKKHQGPDGRKYKTRTCRICFDEVHPTFEPLSTTTQFLSQKPRVRYVSEDPECGRLMRPCKCKGTQKYVHEGCLRAWRMSAGADRNLWKCPTCLYEYKLNRLSWGSWVSSTIVRAGLTLLVLILSVFLLGFIAEPILNFVDPGMFLASFDEFEDLEDWIPNDQPDTWAWHFTRGFFALGIMGVFKSFMVLRPWHGWNIRIGGGARRRRGGGLEDISWVMVLLGVAMFLRVSNIANLFAKRMES